MGMMLSRKVLRKRGDVLYRLGFRSYQEYLHSDLWRSIRKRVRERDGNLCRACGSHAECVHHSRYDLETMRGTDLSGLHCLCGRCHDESHRTPQLLHPRQLKTNTNPCRQCGKPGQSYTRLKYGHLCDTCQSTLPVVAAMEKRREAKRQRKRDRKRTAKAALKEKVKNSTRGRCHRCACYGYLSCNMCEKCRRIMVEVNQPIASTPRGDTRKGRGSSRPART